MLNRNALRRAMQSAVSMRIITSRLCTRFYVSNAASALSETCCIMGAICWGHEADKSAHDKPARGADNLAGAGPREPFSSQPPTPARQTYKSVTPASQEVGPGGFQGFLQSELPGRLGLLLVRLLAAACVIFESLLVFARKNGFEICA